MPSDRTVRRDKRGRRIGYNWWRTYNCDLLYAAAAYWAGECEAVTSMYDTEVSEYAAVHPRPTLKAFLLANAGMNTEPT